MKTAWQTTHKHTVSGKPTTSTGGHSHELDEVVTAMAALDARVKALEAPPPPPLPPPPSGIAVPTTIDATGATDVSAALNAWLRTVADASVVVFKAGGTYLLSTTLSVNGRRNLTLEGNGATLRSAGGWRETNSLITVYQSDGTIIRNFALVGTSPTPGVHIPDKQWAYGVLVGTSTNTEITGVTVSAVYGDAVCVDGWADGVRFHDSRAISTSRAGVSILAGRNVMIERVTFDQTGGSMLDIEAYQADGGAQHVILRDCIGHRRGYVEPTVGLGYLFAGDGAVGSICEDVLITGNHLTACELFVDVTLATRRKNIVVTNNRSDIVAARGPYGAACMNFAHIDGLTITGNVQPLAAGVSMYSVVDCTAVIR